MKVSVTAPLETNYRKFVIMGFCDCAGAIFDSLDVPVLIWSKLKYLRCWFIFQLKTNHFLLGNYDRMMNF